MAQLFIVRGLPGSGKSTYAKKLNVLHFEADMFFIKDGEYKFDFTLLKDAHAWCQSAVKAELNKGNDVVVSNTFTKQWEINPYLDIAKELDADVQVIHVATQFSNIHGVPDDAVARMKDRWEAVAGELVVK